MSKTAIIAEFNPLHNGHLLAIESAKRLGDVIVVMSGGFTQRGEPAIFDKYTRAVHAVKGGADLVAELAPPFSFASAQYFAEAGVLTAAACGADTLLFGSESGKIPDITAENREGLKLSLKKGETFAKAICDARSGERLKPNEILAAEYSLAASRLAPQMRLLPIERRGAGYDSLTAESGFCSSSALRNAATAGGVSDFSAYMPDYALEELKKLPCDAQARAEEKLYSIVRYRALCLGAEGLGKLYGMSEGLNFRFLRAAEQASDYRKFLSLLKTKRYAMSRLKRLCLYVAADLKASTFEQLRTPPQFVNVLAVKREKTPLLRELTVKKIVKPSDKENCPSFEFSRACDALYETVTGRICESFARLVD